MSDLADDAPGALMPAAVKIKKAQELLAGKARSEVYAAIGRGELDALKDGNRTLVTVESIQRYMAALPKAVIKPPAPRCVPASRRARRLPQRQSV